MSQTQSDRGNGIALLIAYTFGIPFLALTSKAIAAGDHVMISQLKYVGWAIILACCVVALTGVLLDW